jgi:hypothetical protein
VPEVIAIEKGVALGSEDVERSKLEVVEGSYGPAILAIGGHKTFGE